MATLQDTAAEREELQAALQGAEERAAKAQADAKVRAAQADACRTTLCAFMSTVVRLQHGAAPMQKGFAAGLLWKEAAAASGFFFPACVGSCPRPRSAGMFSEGPTSGSVA